MCYYITVFSFVSINQVFEFVRREVTAVVCRCFTDSGAEREGFQFQNVSSKIPRATTMKQTWEPNRAKEPSKTPSRNRFEKISIKGIKRRNPGCPFWTKIMKT